MRRRGLALALPFAALACTDATQPNPFQSQVAELGYGIASRVEVDDSITVAAADPAGLRLVGWEARLPDGTLFGADSVVLSGEPTSVTRAWELGFVLDDQRSFRRVGVTAFAVNAAGERRTSGTRLGSASITSAALFSQQASFQQAAAAGDTIVVVAGVTKPLPDGGRIADAIYNRNRNEIYLTNIALDRVEVFQLVDTTFVPGGIPVGSSPWGIALWPRDQTGANADSIVVANSGGTNLSIVDVAGRTERRRHPLPNFLIQSVQTEVDGATGQIKIKIEEFDFSDRPEFLGTFCRDATCSDVYAIYSTTPTPSQQGPFPFRGTVRWENLTNATPESHFFWEHAEVAPGADTDTLQVLVDRGPGTTEEVILAASCGVTVIMEELAFIDTTFVRNSGDFTHALIGEGGSATQPVLEFARAITYDGTAGLAVRDCGSVTIEGVTFDGFEERDLGTSPAIRVRDFIANTATTVRSVALNFNGLTNLIRTTDSVYVLDEGLRLVGTIVAGGPIPGMDLNFDHAFDARQGGTPGTDGGSGDPSNRMVFVAQETADIEIYDTWFYGVVGTIPIRDPITGPLRVGRLPTGEQLIVGVTDEGIVTVSLPAITNPFPSPTRRQLTGN